MTARPARPVKPDAVTSVKVRKVEIESVIPYPASVVGVPVTVDQAGPVVPLVFVRPNTPLAAVRVTWSAPVPSLIIEGKDILVASDVIVWDPSFKLDPDKYKSLNVCVEDPKSYVFVVLGIISWPTALKSNPIWNSFAGLSATLKSELKSITESVPAPTIELLLFTLTVPPEPPLPTTPNQPACPSAST